MNERMNEGTTVVMNIWSDERGTTSGEYNENKIFQFFHLDSDFHGMGTQ